MNILQKNPLEMSNTERKNPQVDELVISCISKHNKNVNNAEEAATLTSSPLFSFSLASGNAETTSRCPHCRPLTIFFFFFFFYSPVDTLTMYVCSRTRTNVKKKGRESERLKQQKKSFLLT
jgi:hypothetical protein